MVNKQEPVNIQRLVRENQLRAEAEVYAQSITSGSIVSSWHEKQHDKNYTAAASRCKGVKACLDSNTSGTNPPALCNATTSAADRMHDHVQVDELAEAYAVVLQQRKARLQELMKQERLQYEAELGSMGLALLKNRD
jgi:hypothetical protein